MQSLAPFFVCDPFRGSHHTHTLLVEAIELQSCHRGWLLGACADLIDRVERMAEDSVYKSTC